MKEVDMSATAVTARLKRVEQLRRLCLSLQKAKLPLEETKRKIIKDLGAGPSPQTPNLK